MKRQWLRATGGKGHAMIVSGWHPAEFCWEASTLHERVRELKRVRLILACRPGKYGGHHPPLLFDRLPIAFMSESVLEYFKPAENGFLPVPITAGVVVNERFRRICTTHVLVPQPNALYDESAAVPRQHHLAMIDGDFCASQVLLKRCEDYVKDVVFKPLQTTRRRRLPTSDDWSHLF